MLVSAEGHHRYRSEEVDPLPSPRRSPSPRRPNAVPLARAIVTGLPI